MMRHRISKKTYFNKIFLLIIGVVLLVFNRSSIGTEYFFSNLHLLVAGACCTLGAIYLLVRPLLLEYDFDHLYVTRGSYTQKIPLKSVVTVKRTMLDINGATYWKVRFINADGKKRAVRFVPYSTIFNEFNEFKFRVQAANPDATILSWSHSFDFDQ